MKLAGSIVNQVILSQLVTDIYRLTLFAHVSKPLDRLLWGQTSLFIVLVGGVVMLFGIQSTDDQLTK